MNSSCWTWIANDIHTNIHDRLWNDYSCFCVYLYEIFFRIPIANVNVSRGLWNHIHVRSHWYTHLHIPGVLVMTGKCKTNTYTNYTITRRTVSAKGTNNIIWMSMYSCMYYEVRVYVWKMLMKMQRTKAPQHTHCHTKERRAVCISSNV